MTICGFFDIVTGDLQRDILALFLLFICQDDFLQRAIDLLIEKGLNDNLHNLLPM